MKFLGSFAIAALFGIALSEAALAQSGRSYPECRSARERHSCNCAVANGGTVYEDPHRPGCMRWRSARLGTGAHTAFMACVQGGGGGGFR
jgi:hypothetical protein